MLYISMIGMGVLWGILTGVFSFIAKRAFSRLDKVEDKVIKNEAEISLNYQRIAANDEKDKMRWSMIEKHMGVMEKSDAKILMKLDEYDKGIMKFFEEYELKKKK